MKNSVTDSLNVILSFMQKWHLSVAGLLNAGLSEKEIEERFKKVGLIPTKELVELYRWHDGTPVEEGTMLDDVQFIPGFHFLCLDDAINNYQAMKDDRRWCRAWFPIFANGGGDFYAADLGQSDGYSAGVIGFILGEKEQETEYQSLTTMLLTFRDGFQNGSVFKAEEGYLEMDDDKYAEIARKNNPELEFWRS